nr:MAG TPA: hypothetical protein [Caudoviricetes sp.]
MHVSETDGTWQRAPFLCYKRELKEVVLCFI